MANICIYKVLVKGKKNACYKLIDMMPLYTAEKEIIREEGSEENFEIFFTGDCKWHVESYTSRHPEIKPYTEEEINAIVDGDGWNLPLIEKSLVLNCEIFCNCKDIDDSSYSDYMHYKQGERIYDECPKELHIKRGRDYGNFSSFSEVSIAKVKFESGAYWYTNTENYIIGDLVYVYGAKEKCLGKIIEIKTTNDSDYYNIKEKIGHANEYKQDIVEEIWKSYKPKDRKEYLKLIGLEENITKQKFINIIETKWNEFSLKNDNWEKFISKYKKGV